MRLRSYCTVFLARNSRDQLTMKRGRTSVGCCVSVSQCVWRFFDLNIDDLQAAATSQNDMTIAGNRDKGMAISFFVERGGHWHLGLPWKLVDRETRYSALNLPNLCLIRP
jgi:hypothetical protein